MKKPKRFIYRKIADGLTVSCYYCPSRTLFSLSDEKDGSEVFCCPECALRIGKIKRLKSLLRKYPLRREKGKNSKDLLIKKIESVPIMAGVGL